MYLFQLFKVFIYWVESKTTENKVKEVLKTFGVVLYNYTLDLKYLWCTKKGTSSFFFS